MNSKTCRVAVIGTGSAGTRHLQLLQRFEGLELVSISKRKGNYEDLKSAAYCIVASNTGCHVEDSLYALEEGCDLLVEKPLSVDAASALAIYEAAQRKGKKLFVGCVLRCSQSLQLFREWLPKIGQVYSVRVECQSFLPLWRPQHPYRQSYSAKTQEGGVLRDLIHEIDYATWIFGYPRHVQARLKNTGLLSIEAEEFAQLWWETKEGVFVSICLDYLSKIPRRRMTAFGEKGNLEWDGMIRKTLIEIPDHPGEEVAEPDLGKMYQTQLEEWLRVCRTTDAGTFLAAGGEGVRALAICDAARRSAASLKAEAICYPV